MNVINITVLSSSIPLPAISWHWSKTDFKSSCSISTPESTIPTNGTPFFFLAIQRMLCQHSFQEWYLLQYQGLNVSNRFQQAPFLIFSALMVTKLKLKHLLLVLLFHIQPMLKKQKAEM
jgi:hypothetical protein